MRLDGADQAGCDLQGREVPRVLHAAQGRYPGGLQGTEEGGGSMIAKGPGYELRLGSCVDPIDGLQSIADKSVDHCIMDPQYSAHVHSCSMRGASGWKGPISEKRELGFDPMTEPLRAMVAREVARIVRRWTLVFSDVESAHLWREALEAVGLEYVRTGFWRKLNGSPQFTGDRPAVGAEAITICHPFGRKRWNGGGRHGIWSAETLEHLPLEPLWYEVPIVIERGAPGQELRDHSTQKPEKLMAMLTEDFTNEGESILDPFAGSATAGAVGLRTGRSFLGWELKSETFKTAAARLGGQHYKLPKVAAAPKQGSLL